MFIITVVMNIYIDDIGIIETYFSYANIFRMVFKIIDDDLSSSIVTAYYIIILYF